MKPHAVILKLIYGLTLSVALFAVSPTYAQDELEVLIPRYEWPNDETADVLLQIPKIRQAISTLLGSDNTELIIRYPGGDAGNQWAIDLNDNLISLGIDSDRITLEPGSGIDETMIVIVDEKRGQ